MTKYPQIGDRVRIKQTGEIRTVKQLWKPGRVVLNEGKGSRDPIFYITGLDPVVSVEEEHLLATSVVVN